MTVTPAVETIDLTRRFGSFAAVDRVSINIGQGEIFGLIGPNGAGKSTLIKMLTTLLPPTSGRASVAGFDIATQSREVRRRIGYVPQLLSSDGALTGYENLLVSARLYVIPRRERAQRIEEALVLMGLADMRDRFVREYSGGMIRRLEIAQSMLHRPEVLFMDEPTVGLDPSGRRAVWEHVRQLREAFGTTLVITTHYMEEADDLCSRIAILHRGRVAATGSGKELKARLGPEATLDDVFNAIAGQDVDGGGGFGDVRLTRLGVEEHA